MTFQDLAQQYLSRHLRGKSSYLVYHRLHRQYFATWTEHPDRLQIRAWHREHHATPAHANRGLGYLRALYNWASNEGLWTEANPSSGIRRHRTYDRERTMTAREVARLMEVRPRLYWKFSALSLVLLTTGCRVGEACAMEWAHLDLDAGSWVKPRTKNGRAHRVPLPRQTCAALIALPRQSRYVFTGAYGQALSRAAVEKTWGRLRTRLRMEDVRLHDFRRTVATRLLDQGEPELLIKAVLNHHRTDVTAIYVRVSFDRIAMALQRHADSLSALVPDTAPQPHPLALPA